MSKSMKRMLLWVGLFFLIVFGWYGIRKVMIWWFVSHYQPPAVTVSAVTVKPQTWQSFIAAAGSLTAINGVDLSAEVGGIVKEIRFNSGQFVKQNDIILTLDTQIEKASLKDKLAQLKLAQMNYGRDKRLYEKNVSSQATLDTRYAELQQAEAAVETTQAQIRQKTISAPFSGRLGIRLINLGQYISPGTTLVTLQSLNPLYVNLNLPEQYLPKLYLNQPVSVEVNYGGLQTVTGKITAINAKVDQTTRNIELQATIPNHQAKLYPGMFAWVKVWLKENKNTMVVPQTAISYSLSGDYIFVVRNESNSKSEKDLHVYRQYVTVGERRNNEVAVIKGLKAGDRIVTSGQLKLQNGAAIVVNNDVGV